MRQVTREQRGAYLRLLNDIRYNGQVIPVKSSMINGNGAMVPLDGGTSLEAYMIITNQFRTSNSLKNGLDYNTSLTIDINTVFSGDSYNSAGSEWVEGITDLVYDALYEDEKFRLKEFGINNDRFIVTSNDSYSQPMPIQYTATSRVFRSVLVFENGIHHLKSEISVPNLWIKTI